MNTNQSATTVLACSQAEEKLRNFLQGLPAEYQGTSLDMLDRLETAHHKMIVEGHVRFTEVVNHAEKFQQASRVFNGLLLDVFTAYTAHDAAHMLRHFRTFNRFVEEMNAPCPSQDDIRAEVMSKLQSCAVA